MNKIERRLALETLRACICHEVHRNLEPEELARRAVGHAQAIKAGVTELFSTPRTGVASGSAGPAPSTDQAALREHAERAMAAAAEAEARTAACSRLTDALERYYAVEQAFEALRRAAEVGHWGLPSKPTNGSAGDQSPGGLGGS